MRVRVEKVDVLGWSKYMVARAEGYFGTPFKGYRCVTYGGPLYPTIFKVFVDEVL